MDPAKARADFIQRVKDGEPTLMILHLLVDAVLATESDLTEPSLQQLQEYETRYQTVADTEDGGEICYIRLFNVGQKVPETFPSPPNLHDR